MFAKETVIPAFKMTKLNRPVLENLIYYSQISVHYDCNEFKKAVRIRWSPFFKQNIHIVKI